MMQKKTKYIACQDSRDLSGNATSVTIHYHSDMHFAAVLPFNPSQDLIYQESGSVVNCIFSGCQFAYRDEHNLGATRLNLFVSIACQITYTVYFLLE